MLDNLKLSYSIFISSCINNNLQIYYTPSSNSSFYTLLGVGADSLLSAIASGANLTDFIANYKDNAIHTVNLDDGAALALASNGNLNPITGGNNCKGLIKSRGDFSPTPTMKLNESAADDEVRIESDSDNNLQIRGPVISDEGSFRDDFNGSSLFTGLTGTLDFTQNSITVTGTGTIFTEEINRDHHIKLASHTNDKLVRVKRVVSDTELELDSEYLGSTGSGAAHKSNWLIAFSGTGANVSVSADSSKVTLASGTANGGTARIYRFVDFGPLNVTFWVSLSQRVANQTITLGLVDDPVGTPNHAIIVTATGTTNTILTFTSQTASTGSNSKSISTIQLPAGTTSSSELEVNIDYSRGAVSVSINGSEVAKSTKHIPYIYENMYLFADVTNSAGIGVSTSVVINEVAVSNDDQLQIANDYRGSPVSTVPSDEVKYIQSTVNTSSNSADQALITYTVPSGYSFLLVGWTISNNGASSAAPLKIGRNNLTENTSPTGNPGGELYEAFDLTANLSTPQRFNESIPVLIGKSGDIIKMAVTPSSNANTKWRVVLRFVLR